MASIGPIVSLSVEKKTISEALGPWSDSLRIPVVQREFEWDEEKIKLLMDSIVRSYPIGTIILWETYDKLPNSKMLGNIEVDDGDGPFSYVIDGQQRLLSLLLLANSWEIMRGKEKVKREPISYNPSTEEFRIGSKVGIDLSLLFNASRGKAVALKELSTNYQNYESPLESIGSKISNYELPIYTLKSPKGAEIDPDVISEIFTRINTSGVRLGNLQIFLSFFASAFPSLKDLMLKKYRELNGLYEDEYPSWEACIRTVFGILDKSQSRLTRKNSFRSTIDEVKSEYHNSSDKLTEVINKAFESMRCGLALLSKELGISSRRFMPSHTVMIPIYKWLFLNDLSEVSAITLTDKRHILKWFLISSVNNYYSTWTDRKLEKSLSVVKAGKGFPIDELISQMETYLRIDRINEDDVVTFQATKPTQMLLLAILHRKNASDWAGHPINSNNITIQHIFPRELLKGKWGTEYIDAIANLTLINGNVNSEIQDLEPKDYLHRFSKDLSDHMIPQSPGDWTLTNFESFLAKRDELIKQEIRNLMNSLS